LKVERSTSFGTGMSSRTGAAKFMNGVIGQRKVETHTLWDVDVGLRLGFYGRLTAVVA